MSERIGALDTQVEHKQKLLDDAFTRIFRLKSLVTSLLIGAGFAVFIAFMAGAALGQKQEPTFCSDEQVVAGPSFTLQCRHHDQVMSEIKTDANGNRTAECRCPRKGTP